MRLFVAVSPPEEVLTLIAALPRPNLQKLRWTTREQWHVTLRFLGEIEEPHALDGMLSQVPAILGLGGDGTSPIEAVLGPAVAWFKGRRILQVPAGGIESLAEAVAQATSTVGEAPDHLPYVGHLTLARVRGPGKGPSNLAGTPFHASWRVDDLLLMSSTLGPGGAQYAIVERVDLHRRT